MKGGRKRGGVECRKEGGWEQEEGVRTRGGRGGKRGGGGVDRGGGIGGGVLGGWLGVGVEGRGGD